jgi:cellulose synthase/poly-beta-1,6-N-acetylglucosamine synthase-like glycosyltransferase
MLALAFGCLAVLVYAYLGYPLLIALLARLRPLRVAGDPQWRPSVTICLCAHNGGPYLPAKLQSLLAQDWPADRLEVLVYSDGSTDSTESVVGAWAARDGRVRLVRGERRTGKPTGLNRLAEAARGEVLLLTDVRQPLDPGATAQMVERLADPRVACVTGNLVLEGAAGSGLYWRYERFVRRNEARFRSMVGMTGSIAVMRRRDFQPLPAWVILDDVWIPMRLRLQGRLIVFAEGAVAHDVALDDEREFARKARTLAGNWQLFALLPGLLSPLHNPSWFETVSHKLLRVLCPFVALLLLAASLVAALQAHTVMDRSLAGALIAGQLLFYGLAAFGGALGRPGRLARTFVVMNAAAVVGLWRFLRGRQAVTW